MEPSVVRTARRARLLAAGCGSGTVGYSEGTGDRANGKVLFTQHCGSCHTLKDAGSSGTVGPNLDDAKPPKALVVTRVTNGKAPMPSFKGQLSADQIDAVATYVSTVAGQ